MSAVFWTVIWAELALVIGWAGWSIWTARTTTAFPRRIQEFDDA